jgi:hypothetical protein
VTGFHMLPVASDRLRPPLLNVTRPVTSNPYLAHFEVASDRLLREAPFCKVNLQPGRTA